MLTIAHAMSLERPKRSVLVMFHAGEELGLLGSEYNTDYAPVVPLNKMVADLNIDMIGRSKQPGDNETEDEHLTDANTVYLVGSNRISQELHQLSEETNAQFQKMKLDYHYNDPTIQSAFTSAQITGIMPNTAFPSFSILMALQWITTGPRTQWTKLILPR